VINPGALQLLICSAGIDFRDR